MGEVRTVGRIMAGWGTLDSRKKKQADHWLLRTSSLFCHCKCLPSSYLSPFPFFSDPLAFNSPSLPQRTLSWAPCTEQFLLRHMCTPSHCRRVLSVQRLVLSLSVHGHEGLSSYSDPEQYPHRLPNLFHPLPDTEQKWQSKKKNSCWMTTWAPILEIKTRLMKVQSNLQSALLPSPTCSIISLFLALFSQMISHSFGGLGTSYSHKQNLVQCLYL